MNVSQSTSMLTSASDSTARSTGQTNSLAKTETFLQLLVAQIRNQDPLSPADGTQFLAQLAQFSQLEQLVGLRSDLNQIAAGATSDSASAASQVVDSAKG
jgi:flagellar basal-body rod modification protein FlgD